LARLAELVHFVSDVFLVPGSEIPMTDNWENYKFFFWLSCMDEENRDQHY
jgi:hypothetical protein